MMTPKHDTVDGWTSTNQLRLVVYPISYTGFIHPKVVQDFSNQRTFGMQNFSQKD